MPAPLVPRPALLEALRERASRRGPLLLSGPPGAGKTTLLAWLAADLEAAGQLPISLDFFGSASSPSGFVEATLAALPAGPLAGQLREAEALRALASAGRERGAEAVAKLLRFLASLDEADGRPVVLLVDDVTEIRSLAYFAGLREVAADLADALGRRRGASILATSFPTQAARWFAFDSLPVPPFSPSELAGLGRERAAHCVRGSFGWARALRVLLEEPDVVAHWTREMEPGGRLETACRATYETLLLRSRGYGMSKAVLALVAERDGQTLTDVYRRLGRSPGATRDYLGWLLEVDILRAERKRYSFTDGLLRVWLQLHGRGARASRREVERAAAALFSGEAPPAEAFPAEIEAAARRDESLIEID